MPLLATRSVIRQLTTSLDEVTKRQAALQEDIDGQVEERLGRAITERQQLRRRLQERESELKRLRRLVDETEPLSEELSPERSSWTTRSLVRRRAATTSILFMLISFSGLILFTLLNRDNSSPLISILTLAISLGSTILRLIILERYRHLEKRIGESECKARPTAR